MIRRIIRLLGNLFRRRRADAELSAEIESYLELLVVASQSVAQRTRELGIRRALGAADSQLYRMVMIQSMTPVAWGIGAGVLGGLAATQILKGLRFGIEPTDPPTFAIVAVMVAGVALFACAVPARRAARVDPIIALRDG